MRYSNNMSDHPDIEWCERTGYPSWNQPKTYFCDRCGEEIEGEIYEDTGYDCLCEQCVLELHRKDW